MESRVIKTGLKNTIYVVGAQSISLLLGIARTLILPIFLGVENFGYWQVYLLYMSYVGVFSLGFNDGIYLRYGRYEYNDLPRKIFRSSIRVFIVIEIIIMLLVSTFIVFEPDPSKQLSMLWSSINIPIAGLTGVLIYVLQITNQLKKYSFYTILDKIITFAIIIVVFFLKIDNFIILIVADTLSKVLVLFLMINSCRGIIFGKGSGYKLALKETIANISVGMKLMLANFAGMLVLGFGRFLVERFSSIQTYGTYSFAISTMNLVLVLITAIGLVIYPTLNRLDKGNYSNYFIKLNQILGVIIFGLLLAIFPLKIFISLFMPDYISIFSYLAIIFAIMFVQSKMQILINPYYKLLRKESVMLRANIVGLVISAILITPLYMLTKSVAMVAIGTLLAMTIRLYLSEIYLKKELNISNKKNIILEVLGMLIFIVCGLVGNSLIGVSVYLLIYSIFFIKRIKNAKIFIQYFLRK